jgi:beta-mannosidase
VVSDQLKPLDTQLQIRLLDFSGKVLSENKQSINVPANTSTNVYRVAVKDLLKGADRSSVVLDISLLNNQQALAQNCLYFELPKALKLNKAAIKSTLTKSKDGYVLKLTSTQLAKNLRVSAGDDAIIFSDNYFDLLPGQEKTITFKSSKALKKSNITFLAINDVNK